MIVYIKDKLTGNDFVQSPPLTSQSWRSRRCWIPPRAPAVQLSSYFTQFNLPGNTLRTKL